MPPWIPDQGYINQSGLDLSGWPTAGDGKKYLTLSVYAKTDASDNLSIGGTFCSNTPCDSSCSVVSDFSTSTTGPATAWTQVSGTFEIPEAAQCIQTNMGHSGYDGPSTVYWDDAQAYSSGPTAVTLNGLAARGGAALPVFGLLALGAVGLVLVKRRH